MRMKMKNWKERIHNFWVINFASWNSHNHKFPRDFFLAIFSLSRNRSRLIACNKKLLLYTHILYIPMALCRTMNQNLASFQKYKSRESETHTHTRERAGATKEMREMEKKSSFAELAILLWHIRKTLFGRDNFFVLGSAAQYTISCAVCASDDAHDVNAQRDQCTGMGRLFFWIKLFCSLLELLASPLSFALARCCCRRRCCHQQFK
jgi:hypothetical protein